MRVEFGWGGDPLGVAVHRGALMFALPLDEQYRRASRKLSTPVASPALCPGGCFALCGGLRRCAVAVWCRTCFSDYRPIHAGLVLPPRFPLPCHKGALARCLVGGLQPAATCSPLSCSSCEPSAPVCTCCEPSCATSRWGDAARALVTSAGAQRSGARRSYGCIMCTHACAIDRRRCSQTPPVSHSASSH